jgi:thiol-disulfide isomerase/thioredoxin
VRALGLSLHLVVGLLLTLAPVVDAADVRTITHGREVELVDHLVPGKYVIFDFYADWCGPCRALEPRLLDLAGRHEDRLAVRKIDIINWDSAVARQYGLSSIPHLRLYGPDGAQLAAGDAGTVLAQLGQRIGSGGFPASAPPAGGSPLVPLLAVGAIFSVAVALVVRRRNRPAAEVRPISERLEQVDTAAAPGDPAIWFAMLQGSLEGPMTRAQLAELVKRGVLRRSTEVRRRGDADWTAVADVLD